MNEPERFSDLRVLRWADRIGDVLTGEVCGPIRCSLDLTNLCGDHCFFCEPAEYRAETVRDQRHTLDTQVAFAVLEDLKALDCRTVNFSGGGEPTLHPDFGQLLTRAVALGFRTWVVTHGGHIKKWLQDLLRADHIRVSLDASNEEQHRAMHRSKPGEFAERIEGIGLLAGAKCGSQTWRPTGYRAKPEVGISYLLGEGNSDLASLDSICEQAERIGVDFIHFRPLSLETATGPVGLLPVVQAAMEYAEETLQAKFPKLAIFPIPKRGTDVFYQREFSKCYAALTLAVVGANGEVQACCDRRDIVFGNVYQRRFRDIWLGAAHRAKAAAIVPQLCQRCLMCGTNRAIEKYMVRNEALPELL